MQKQKAFPESWSKHVCCAKAPITMLVTFAEMIIGAAYLSVSGVSAVVLVEAAAVVVAIRVVVETSDALAVVVAVIWAAFWAHRALTFCKVVMY